VNITQSLKLNASAIGIFAAITAAIIALTFVVTKAPIKENIRLHKSAKLFEIINNSPVDNDIFGDTVVLDGEPLGSAHNIKAHIASYKGLVTTVIFPVVTDQGYSGNISLLVGVKRDASIAGVRVISHRETPGLGDKLELKKSAWVLAFNGLKKKPAETWAVKKDGGEFDQFTGATITPRAVVNAVSDTLDYFHQHRDRLLNSQTPEVKTNAN
jgi:electron transport complex protein RnfG